MTLQQRHRWNITIVVLLLMVASGLLALLTLQFVKHFLTSSSVLDNYYKAYYMARGGLEVLLTEANVRGYGFQYDLSESPTLAGNYYKNCVDLGLCDLQGEIDSHGVGIYDSVQSLVKVNCDPIERITLQPGASSAFPLFYDAGAGANISFAPVQAMDYQKLGNFGFALNLSWGSVEAYLYNASAGNFGQITATQQVSVPGASHLFSQQPLAYTHRLILTNPGTNAVSYCLNSDDAAQKLVGNFTTITTQATYNDKTVGVTAVKKFVFPSVFIQ